MKSQVGNFIRNNAGHPAMARIARACATYLKYYFNERNWRMDTNGERRSFEKWLSSVARPTNSGPAAIIDIGANAGEWAEMAAGLLDPPLRQRWSVIAFEPNPTPFARLAEMRDRLNRDGPVLEVHNVAISNRDGVEVLSIPAGDDTAASLAPRGTFRELVRIEIVLMSLTGFEQVLAGRKLGFLKIDTEGHEAIVLETLLPLIGRDLPVIQFEYGKTFVPARRSLGDIAEMLEPLGYRLARIHPSWLQYFTYDLDEHEHFRYGNYAAVPEALAQTLG